MSHPISNRVSFFHDQRGVTLVEYALLIVAILLVTAGAWKLLGRTIDAQAECAARWGNGCADAKRIENSMKNSEAASLGEAPAGAPPISFDQQVEGQKPIRLDRTLADLAGAAKEKGNFTIPKGPFKKVNMKAEQDEAEKEAHENIDGFRRLSNAELLAAHIDPSHLHDGSNFNAVIYTDDHGDYVLAFAGTDALSLQDWKTDFQQGLGMGTQQYSEAVRLAWEAKHAFQDNLVLTGHSKGGGEASAAAVITNTPAVTFNPAGVTDQTIAHYGVDPAAARKAAEEGLVRRYQVNGDILTGLQDHSPLALERNVLQDMGPLRKALGPAGRVEMPDALGQVVKLRDPNPMPAWQKPGLGATDHLPSFVPHVVKSVLNLGAKFLIPPLGLAYDVWGAKHAIQNHFIGAVTKSMDKYPPWP